MRGTPFLKEGFTGGLNTISDPYLLDEKEARECLNVVSTERGSIKKRTGSVIFANPAAKFPSLGVTDSFERGNEKPLSNGAKWTLITEDTTAGEVKEEAWNPTSVFPKFGGAYWNVEEKTNPAVSLELQRVPAALSRYFGAWACYQAGARSGYLLRAEQTALETEEKGVFTATIEKWVAGSKTVLATITGLTLENTDAIGLTVRAGVLTAWKRHSAIWAEVGKIADATYATGYTGIEASGNAGRYKNFSFGEMEAALEVELNSLFSCTISGTRYLLAAGGTNLYSITAAGELHTIGEGFTEGKRWSMVQAPTSVGIASEGPVYMTNGTDKAQYWTGAEAKTKVKEWTGIESAPKLTDGICSINRLTLKSKTAKFIATDLGLNVTFETAVKSNGVEIKTAHITAVNSSEEVTLEINEKGWEATVEAVHFTLSRAYYETVPHIPQGKYMVFAGNRIWMTGIASDPSAVWFTELVPIGIGGSQADPSSWPNTNVVRFDSSDGKPISGIGTVGPYLLVFKEQKTWAVHDLNSGANRKIADKIGCVAHRSIVEVAGTGSAFFLTADQGVYETNGSTLKEMSYNVRPTILGINPAQREVAAGEYWNNHYYLSFAAGTSATNNRTLDYDAVLKSWWLHDLAGNQWARFEATTGEPSLFTVPAKVKGGVVKAFVPGVYQDSGANYTGNGILGAFWVSAWEPFAYYIFRHRIKAPFLKKRVRQIFFNGEGQIIPSVYRNFTVGERQEKAVSGHEEIATGAKIPTEFGASTEKWGEGEGLWGVEGSGEVLWGGETTVGQARIYAPGVANVWSVGFGNNSAEPFVVEAFVFMVQFRKS